MKKFTDSKRFVTELGDTLESLTIAYHTFGRRNDDDSNIIWVCHALTANSDVADWWPNTVVEGRFLDPSRYYIVCANVLGSCYGTSGPADVDPETGRYWGEKFPCVSVRDIVNCHRRLAEHLGIKHVEMLIGSSLGGFQCLEWAIMDPTFARNLVLIATGSYTRPWAAAFNEAQRMAMRADKTYGMEGGGLAGMAAARAIAMLSYRGGHAYDVTQQDTIDDTTPPFSRRAASYQRHQGEKLARRFDPVSYMRMTQAVDSHDVGRGRGGVAAALATVKARTLVIAITGDILFTPADHTDLATLIPGAVYREIDSAFGHDGFLIENQLLDSIIKEFL
ncbi:MAG: homoserine O-acetyltransferase [Muribaculaceae bacterium]|nr:homoserine O-acetyltransferase [Muribaculaceae bacterium]